LQIHKAFPYKNQKHKRKVNGIGVAISGHSTMPVAGLDSVRVEGIKEDYGIVTIRAVLIVRSSSQIQSRVSYPIIAYLKPQDSWK